MDLKELRTVCDLQNGYAFKSDDYLETSNTVSLRMSNIRPGGKFDNGYNLRYLPDDFQELYSNYLITDGDLVIAMTDLANDPKILGIPTIVETGNVVWLLNQRAGKLIVKDPTLADKNYLRYILNHPIHRNYYKMFAGGGLQINVGKKEILGVKIPIPPLKTQQRIAGTLDNAAALRDKTAQLLTEYDLLAQSIFLEMFGDLINNQKEWTKTSFDNIFNSIRYGTSSPPIYQESGIPFIRATNVKKGGVAEKGLVYISKEESEKIEKCRLKEGDLIIVRSGANTGDCSRIPKKYADAFGGFDIIIEIDEPQSTFCNFLLNTNAAKAVLDPLTRRAGQPHINSKQLSELELINPPIELQNEFADKIALIEQQKALAKQELQESEDLFNCLLQQAFKGEL
jgi:restriction endonuclease S subunit